MIFFLIFVFVASAGALDSLTVTVYPEYVLLTASFTDQQIRINPTDNYTVTIPPSTIPLTLVLAGPLTPPPKDFEILFYYSVAVWMCVLVLVLLVTLKWAYWKPPPIIVYKYKSR
nr:ORF85 [Acipenserid herpesvirus 1]